MDRLITVRRPDLVIISKKKKDRYRTWWIIDFASPADHWVKRKENEKKDEIIDLAKGLKKVWNMKVTVIPIVIGPLGTVTKGFIVTKTWKKENE